MTLGGIPVEFYLFAVMLAGVAILHHHTLAVALAGLITVAAFALIFGRFSGPGGASSLAAHFAEEWVTLVNLFGLLLGFAVVARHFELTRIPDIIPRFLPDDWKGGLVLLALVFVLSAFLDNIAAAIIGGTIAGTVFRQRVSVGFVAAIVAAANAGGAGSVIGDTTTTMMWLEGIPPTRVLHAYVASVVAFLCFAIPASLQQQRLAPVMRNAVRHVHIDWARFGCVAFVLTIAVAMNVLVSVHAPQRADAFPFLGAAIWGAILLTTPLRRPEWRLLPAAARGALFLVALVACASLMPVESLPAASWPTALGLGFVSAVFDNIPLTKIALAQGGYDWGVLAYAVGFGGSMIWFGSSAGVAVSTQFPEARSVGAWLKGSWYIIIAYLAGFAAMLAYPGWQPPAPAS
jgi:Na+/H+ antiporter NhaD/arsenite permease-like protein